MNRFNGTNITNRSNISKISGLIIKFDYSFEKINCRYNKDYFNSHFRINRQKHIRLTLNEYEHLSTGPNKHFYNRLNSFYLDHEYMKFNPTDRYHILMGSIVNKNDEQLKYLLDDLTIDIGNL